MKKISLLTLVGVLFTIALVGVASAQDASTTPDSIRDRIEQRRSEAQERQEEREDRVEERRERLSERRANIVERHAKRMKDRIEAAIKRIERLTERANDAVERFGNKGADVSTAEEALLGAEGILTELELLLVDYDETLEDVLTSDEPRVAFEDMKVVVREIIGKIKEAHASVIGAVRSLNASGIVDDEKRDENSNDEEEDDSDDDDDTATTTDNS